jgi:coproporphyrinogen III oxidase-like Fe-S oxidoreductase
MRRKLKVIHTLRDAGFTNINIDIMFGLLANRGALKATLEKQCAAARHISAYCLTYRKTPVFSASVTRRTEANQMAMQASLK